MIDNQGTPGTDDAVLADGRIDPISSTTQAQTQIDNYQASAAQDKDIIESSASSGTEVKDAEARYKAAEFDIAQVKDAESGLVAEQTTPPTASPAAVTTTPTPENETQGALLSEERANEASTAQSSTSVAAVTTTPTYDNETQGALLSEEHATDSSATPPTASVASVTTTPTPENETQGALLSEERANETSTTVPYTIAQGDNLTDLAKKYNTTVALIQEANSKTITDPDMIYAGRTINIPMASANQGAIGKPNLGNEGGTTFGSQTQSPEEVALDPKQSLVSRLTGRWKA